MSHNFDVVVAVPPLSPTDTNPPLGPYLLKTCAANAGLRLDVADMSVRYLNRFKPHPAASVSRVIGDQDKDRAATHAARDHYLATCPLKSEAPLYLPTASNPILGMHYGFESIERAIDRACEPSSSCRRFVEEALFSQYPVPPRVLGLSIMGPPQVFFALLVARLSKRRWPTTRVVGGGSHVTLLAEAIATDCRYGADFDLFMPGHSEVHFVEVVRHILQHDSLPPAIGIGAGDGRAAACTKAISPTVNGRPRSSTSVFEYRPSLDADAIRLYDPARVTIPMQLTRGCAFGQCTYCTYPAVEPTVDIEPDWPRVIAALAHLVEATGVRRVSFKDSLFTVKNLRTLARVLREAGVDIEWSATTLLNAALTRAFLSDLFLSGCRTLEFGLETIDPAGQSLFAKPLDVAMCESVLRAATDTGIAVVINQILGWPGQTVASVERQVAWYESIRSRAPELIHASFNLLEVNRGSPLALEPMKFGVVTSGIAPWAFSYAWNAPPWTSEVKERLRAWST